MIFWKFQMLLKMSVFVDNPLVTDPETPVIFYAGVPLISEDGHAIGNLMRYGRET